MVRLHEQKRESQYIGSSGFGQPNCRYLCQHHATLLYSTDARRSVLFIACRILANCSLDAMCWLLLLPSSSRTRSKLFILFSKLGYVFLKTQIAMHIVKRFDRPEERLDEILELPGKSDKQHLATQEQLLNAARTG